MGLHHVLNCIVLLATVFTFEYAGGGLDFSNAPDQGLEAAQFNSWEAYGWFTIILYVCRYLTLLALPQAVVNFLGLLFFQSFPEKPKLKYDPAVFPFICFRVVTRGDYPELVRNNCVRNLNICRDAGLKDFVIEVVTDKSIALNSSQQLHETVVPSSYQTRSGAMFKARALQYCLEEEVNTLKENDWIVHLDEETLLTEGCVKGIINFVCNGKHQFGQGVITYGNEEVVNYFLTLCDTLRVAEDMGKIQFQLKVLHMPLFGWKGSFVVSQCGAERKVTYDNGPDSSVAEDTYFGIWGASQGYSYSFIEGEMWEKSPFNLMDFLQQRKRWLQGLLLVAHSSKIPFKYRIFLAISVYSWVTLPLTTCNFFLQPLFPFPLPKIVDICVNFIGGMWIYMYLYGTLRTFSIRRVGLVKFLVFLMMGIIVTPFKVVIELIAVIWGLVTTKHKFFVVKKDVTQIV